MTRSCSFRRLTLVVAGVVVFAAGVAVGTWYRGPDATPVFAATAASDDAFAVCTVPIGNVTEGLFLLDFETGDLTGGVLNGSTAKFAASYRHNVLKDLGFKAGKVKGPKFLLTTGLVEFVGNTAAGMAASVLYVTDVATGVTVAYGIPWSAQQPQVGAALVPLDKAQPRGGKAP
jgi:hypothetical protein